jgi:hypothetical protein
MDNDQKKLMRRFTVLWFISLGLILGILFLAVRNNRDETHHYVDQQIKSASLTKPIQEIVNKPIPGKDGRDGKDGKDGRNGTNAISTNTVVEKPVTTVIQQNVPVQGAKGDKGDQGEPGTSGRELELGKQDGQIVWRYTGDEAWQTLTEVGN